MSAARDRKEASKRLGIALQAAYRRMIEADGQDEIQTAAVELGQLFNDNIGFTINVLKAYGGMQVIFEKRPPQHKSPVGWRGSPATTIALPNLKKDLV